MSSLSTTLTPCGPATRRRRGRSRARYRVPHDRRVGDGRCAVRSRPNRRRCRRVPSAAPRRTPAAATRATSSRVTPRIAANASSTSRISRPVSRSKARLGSRPPRSSACRSASHRLVHDGGDLGAVDPADPQRGQQVDETAEHRALLLGQRVGRRRVITAVSVAARLVVGLHRVRQAGLLAQLPEHPPLEHPRRRRAARGPRGTTASQAIASDEPVKYAGVTGSADEGRGAGCRTPPGRSSCRPAGIASPATQSAAFSRVK